MTESERIAEAIKSGWTKYSPKILSVNKDGVLVEMDDFDERYLFYVFINPYNKSVQVNEISGFRKRFKTIEFFEDRLNN